MSTNQTVINYMKLEYYGVVYLQEAKVFKIVDRNGEIAFSNTFNNAAAAIDFAFKNYKGLNDE